ncbi:hypothetical protein ZWY2020_022525 [Hordeum vulgare]|nr:hypothetical protein ZWY2020_022525 [Hordeum vulgare]
MGNGHGGRTSGCSLAAGQPVPPPTSHPFRSGARPTTPKFGNNLAMGGDKFDIGNHPTAIGLSSQDKPDVFLCLEELSVDDMHMLPNGSSNVAIEVSNGCFSWDDSP